jgi:type III secretion protein Q
MAIAFNETASLHEAFAAHPDGLGAKLRRATPAQAQGARVLFDARIDTLAASIAGVEAWRLDPLDAAVAHAFDDPGRIALAHVTGTLAIDIDLARHPALRVLASASGTQSLRQSIAAALLSPLADALIATGTGAWRVTDVTRIADTPLPDDTLSATVALTFEGREYNARLHAAPAMLALFEHRLHAIDTAPLVPAWRVPGRITLGGRRIAIAALEKLRPGDILLRCVPPQTEAALRAGEPFHVRAAWGTPGHIRLAAQAGINGGSLAITEDPIMTDDPQHMDDGDAPLTAELQSEPIEIGELDLPVQFELDSVALPLGQLAALRAGYVIELETPVTDARIRLVAHGQTIGYGELIAVADHLGIRIVRMAHDDGSVR